MHQKHQQTSTPHPDGTSDALDLAARIAEPYPEEAEAIERVTRFVRGHAAGEPQRSDVLLALSILITAVDRDSTAEQQALFTLLEALLGGPPRSAAPPSPTNTAQPHAPRVTVQQRSRPLARRGAPARRLSTLSTHFAA